MLSVTRQSSSMNLFFRDGKIISTRDRRRGACDPLKDYLARYGIALAGGDRASDRDQHANRRLDFTDVIVSEGVLGEEELARHCRNHIQEAVYDVLGWEQCSYKFIAGSGSGGRRQDSRRSERRGAAHGEHAPDRRVPPDPEGVPRRSDLDSKTRGRGRSRGSLPRAKKR